MYVMFLTDHITISITNPEKKATSDEDLKGLVFSIYTPKIISGETENRKKICLSG